jgi:hypothetical protein
VGGKDGRVMMMNPIQTSLRHASVCGTVSVQLYTKVNLNLTSIRSSAQGYFYLLTSNTNRLVALLDPCESKVIGHDAM